MQSIDLKGLPEIRKPPGEGGLISFIAKSSVAGGTVIKTGFPRSFKGAWLLELSGFSEI